MVWNNSHQPNASHAPGRGAQSLPPSPLMPALSPCHQQGLLRLCHKIHQCQHSQMFCPVTYKKYLVGDLNVQMYKDIRCNITLHGRTVSVRHKVLLVEEQLSPLHQEAPPLMDGPGYSPTPGLSSRRHPCKSGLCQGGRPRGVAPPRTGRGRRTRAAEGAP
jgi:hypothetical protein